MSAALWVLLSLSATLFQIPDNCSADNFIIKLNMSGWQRLSCLVLFFLSHSLFIDSRKRRWGEHAVFWLLAPCPCKKLVKFTRGSNPTSLSSFLLFPLPRLLSDLRLASSTYWQDTRADQQQTHGPTTPCFVLLCFLVGLNHDTDLLQLKCLPFTNSLIWLEKTCWKKKEKQTVWADLR